jgi:hypothetical protein
MRKPLAAFALAGALVTTSGCDLLQPKLDKGKLEALVRSLLEREQIKIDSISCPADQPVTKGHTFECLAVCVGVEVHFSMEVIDDQGTVMAKPRSHTVVVKSVENEIAEDLRKLGHSVQSVDCHGEVWVSVPGAIATCDIVDEAGAKYLWTAEFTDDRGTHNHKIEPV